MLLGLFMMLVLFYAGVTFHRLLPTELHAANALNSDRQARYVAEAGVLDTLAWQEKRLARGQGLTKEVRRGKLEGWRWQCEVSLKERGILEFRSLAIDPKHNPRLQVTARAQRDSFASYSLVSPTARAVLSPSTATRLLWVAGFT